MCHHRNGLITAGGLIEKHFIGRITIPIPLKEEIRLKIFGSPDWTVFLSTLVSDRHSRLLLENWFEILGTIVKTCLKVTGTPVKTCLKFWRNCNYEVRSFPPVDSTWVCVSLS